MRVFIAINLTENMKHALGCVIRDMKKSGARGNYTLQENLHLTLAFIGEVADVAETMEVTGFSLMKSERVNGRMKYTELACWEVH